MIKSISIERFRGIREGRLEDLSPLTVLVGPNGSGKSSVMDALLVANDDHPAEALRHVAERRVGETEPARWIFYRADQAAGAKLSSEHDGPQRRVIEIARKAGDPKLYVSVTGVDAAGAPFERSPQMVQWGPKQRVEAYQPDLLPPSTPGDSAIRLVQPDRPDLEHDLPVLYTHAFEAGRSAEVVAQVSAVSGATDVRIGAPRGKGVLYLVFPDHAIPAAAGGEGIHALLLLSLELAVRAGNTILLEEPEAHLHPRAIRQAARAVWTAVRRGVQVVLSTHSLEMIDALLAESTDADLKDLSLYRLALRGGELRKSRVAADDIGFLRAQIDEDLR